MHTGPMKDSDGTFSAERVCTRPCAHCRKQTDHKGLTWDSSCGGYTDYKFTCLTCGAVHWVEGSDS